MLFLVSGRVSVRHYMQNATTTDEIRIVEAEDWEKAEEKFTQFFEDQSRPYDVSYSVDQVLYSHAVIT